MEFLMAPENITIVITGITFIGIIINAGVSFLLEKMRTKAEVISRARIEWIQNVRKESAEFIALCYKYLSIDCDDKETRWEISKSASLIILYFGPSDNQNKDVISNESVVEIIKRIESGINRDKIVFSENKKRADELKNEIRRTKKEVIESIELFRDEIRKYLKKEWKRASKNKK